MCPFIRGVCVSNCQLFNPHNRSCNISLLTINALNLELKNDNR